jgi:hypothetical protein
MLKKIVSYLITVLFPICVFAQTGNDSLLLNYQKKISENNFLKHNLSSPSNFGEVSLDYSSRKGDRRLSQEAHNRNGVEFYALGANQLGKFRVSGDFLFDKIFEDSLAFGQRNGIDRFSPFNYYASKAGKYERQNYKANVTLSYDWKWGIQPFFNVNYLHHWTTGSVDPRFDSKKFEMKYNPGLIFHINESKLGFKAILGNGRENLGVSYKNKNFSSSLLYPDRIHYLNMGYGFNNIKDTLNTRKYSKIFGGEVSLNTKLGKSVLDFSSSFERKDENNSNDIKSTKIYNIRSTYTEDLYTLQGLLQIPQTNNHHLISIKGNYVNGNDGHIEFSNDRSRINYSVNYLETNLGYLFTRKRPTSWNYDIGFDVNYFSIQRKDYASTIDVNNTFVQLSPAILLRYQQKELDNIQFGFAPSYTKSINNSIQYSQNSLNSYIEGVVFWDYDYYRSNAIQLNWSAKWNTKRISSQYWTGIKIDYSYARNLNSNIKESLSNFGSNASVKNFSIGLYLNL